MRSSICHHFSARASRVAAQVALVAVAAFSMSQAANAQVRGSSTAGFVAGPYIGFGAGVTQFGLKKEDFTAIGGPTRTFDERDNGFKVFGGYRFLENFAVEGQYARLGKSSIRYSAPTGLRGTEKYEASSFSVAAVGLLPISDNFTLFAKAGPSFNNAKSTFSNTTLGASSKGNKLGLVAGIGASYKLTENISARAELENFSRVGEAAKGGRSSVNMVSLGLAYQF
jgi:OmpA-OmpF porin, OOP family